MGDCWQNRNELFFLSLIYVSVLQGLVLGPLLIFYRLIKFPAETLYTGHTKVVNDFSSLRITLFLSSSLVFGCIFMLNVL